MALLPHVLRRKSSERVTVAQPWRRDGDSGSVPPGVSLTSISAFRAGAIVSVYTEHGPTEWKFGVQDQGKGVSLDGSIFR